MQGLQRRPAVQCLAAALPDEVPDTVLTDSPVQSSSPTLLEPPLTRGALQLPFSSASGTERPAKAEGPEDLLNFDNYQEQDQTALLAYLQGSMALGSMPHKVCSTLL